MNTPEINILFDYMSITFPMEEREVLYLEQHGSNWEIMRTNPFFMYFMSIIDLDTDCFVLGGKIPYYEQLITYGEFITFKFNGPLNARGIPTHSLELKGEGCREVELLSLEWIDLLEYVITNDLKVTTTHLACDIFTPKYFSIEQLLKKSIKDEFVSPLRKFSYIQGQKNGVSTGTSLYYGSREGNQINIYDKKNERYYKGYQVDTNFWVRIEIRLKTKANSFINLLVASGYESFPRLYRNTLLQLLRFIVPDATRKDRCSMWRPWERLLHGAESAKLLNQVILESSLVKKKEHLLHSYGKTILEIVGSMTDEEKFDFYIDIVDEKIKKIDNKSLTRVNYQRMRKGLTPFKDLQALKDYLRNTGLL